MRELGEIVLEFRKGKVLRGVGSCCPWSSCRETLLLVAEVLTHTPGWPAW